MIVRYNEEGFYENVFLSQFLMISEWKTIVFLIAYLLLAFAVYKLPKKNSAFPARC